MKIHEVELNPALYEQTVNLPSGATILSLSFNGDNLMAYYSGDEENDLEPVRCYLVGVGTQIVNPNSLNYVAATGSLHLFTA